jgi:hypothetical protein
MKAAHTWGHNRILPVPSAQGQVIFQNQAKSGIGAISKKMWEQESLLKGRAV